MRLLKNLVVAGFVSEYDVVGITDPFLQVNNCRRASGPFDNVAVIATVIITNARDNNFRPR